MSTEEIVDRFIATITGGDLEGALALCTDDLEYDNVPMPTLHGIEAARGFLAGMLGEGVRTEWTVHRQVAAGDTVLNERTDEFWFGDVHIALPVAGVFVVRDGKIALWRDYFDLRTFETQMAGEAPAPT
jgi:limonene-1,2-epoxide hydrolase